MSLANALSVACPWCFVDVDVACVDREGKPRKKLSHHVRQLRANHGDAASAVITKILRHQEAREEAEQAKKEGQ